MGKQSTAKGFAMLSLSGITIKLISLVFIPIILAVIGEEGNGLYSAANQVFAFVYVLTNSGTLNAITKMISEYATKKSPADADKAFRVSRTALGVIGGIFSVLLIIVAGSLSSAMQYPEARLSIIALAPSVFLTSIISGYRGYFQGMHDFKPRARSQLLEQITNVLSSLGLALIGMNLPGTNEQHLVWACAGANGGTTIAALVAMLYLMSYMKRYRRNQKRAAMKERKVNMTKNYLDELRRNGNDESINADKKEIKHEDPDIWYNRYTAFKWVGKILRLLNLENTFPSESKGILRLFLAYSIPITLASGLQYATNIIDAANTKMRLLAAGFEWGQATAMYGYVSKYQQIINVPMIVIIALGSTVLPRLAGAKVLKDTRDFKNSLIFAYRWCFIVTLPMVVGIYVLGQPIYSTIKYGVGGDLLSYASIIVLFMGLTQIQSSILQGMGRLYAMSFFLTIGLSAKILVNYFLIAIPEINIYGTIIGSVCCYVLTAIIGQIYIRKHQQRVRVPIFRYIIKPAIAALVMGGVVWCVYKGIYAVESLFMSGGYLMIAIPTLLSIVAGAVTYIFVFYMLRGIKEYDLEMLPDSLVGRIPKRARKRIGR